MSCGYPCGPSCVTPTCIPTCIPSCPAPVSYPVGGLGSMSSCGGISYSGGVLSSGGGAASAGSLGILAGASVGCVCQAPPSEIVIQPAPCVVTCPGPILSASCEPARVGGYSACGGAPVGGGALGISSSYGRLGSSGMYKPYISRKMSIGNVCGSPC